MQIPKGRIYFLSFGWVLVAGLASGASPTPKPAVSRAPRPAPSAKPVAKFIPIEVLRERFEIARQLRTKSRIQKIVAALESESYRTARTLAMGLDRDPLIGDLGISWIAGALRGEANQQLIKKHPGEAISSAQQALGALVRIEAEFPYSPLIKSLPEMRAALEFILGDAYFMKKQGAPALNFYERAFQRLASGGQLPSIRIATLERYAQSCRKGASGLCAAWIPRLIALSPKNSPENRMFRTYFAELVERTPPSYSVGKVSTTYRGPELDLAAFDSAFTLYLDKKTGAAIKAFQQLLDDYPRSAHRFRARYWLAQLLERDGEIERAKKLYVEILKEVPLTYYGLLSSFAIGREPRDAISAELPLGTTEDPFLQPQEFIRLKRVERFIQEGAPQLAGEEVRDLKPRSGLSNPFLLYLATINSALGQHDASFGLVQEMINRGYPGIFTTYGLRLIFPIEFQDLIVKYANLNKLSPILVISLMKQESAFNPAAGSGVGAAGLTQLMPATATDLDGTVKRADLTDPETNVRLGTKYLRAMLNKFNGNSALALAAYNAGPNAIDRWVREGKSKAGIREFIELIPYKETREYVSAIIRNCYWYATRVTGDPQRDLESYWNGTGGGMTAYTPPAIVTTPEPEPSPSISPDE